MTLTFKFLTSGLMHRLLKDCHALYVYRYLC